MMIQAHAYPTLIAEATRLRGDLTFYSEGQVHGVIEGTVIQHSLEPMMIGATGWISGIIQSKGPVIIEGRADGEIISSTKIVLKSTAQVRGQLTAPVIQILPGALLDGKTTMEAQHNEAAFDPPALLAQAA